MVMFKSCYIWRSSDLFPLPPPPKEYIIYLTLRKKVIFKTTAHKKYIVLLYHLFYQHSWQEKACLFFSVWHDYSVIFIFGPTSSLFILVISLQYGFLTDFTKDFIAITQLNQDSTLNVVRKQTKLTKFVFQTFRYE